MVKNLPAMQRTQVPSLSWEDPLKKGIRGVHGVTESHVTERFMKLLNKGKNTSVSFVLVL